MDALDVSVLADHLVWLVSWSTLVAFVVGLLLGSGWDFVQVAAERIADRYAAWRGWSRNYEPIPGLDVIERP